MFDLLFKDLRNACGDREARSSAFCQPRFTNERQCPLAEGNNPTLAATGESASSLPNPRSARAETTKLRAPIIKILFICGLSRLGKVYTDPSSLPSRSGPGQENRLSLVVPSVRREFALSRTSSLLSPPFGHARPPMKTHPDMAVRVVHNQCSTTYGIYYRVWLQSVDQKKSNEKKDTRPLANVQLRGILL